MTKKSKINIYLTSLTLAYGLPASGGALSDLASSWIGSELVCTVNEAIPLSGSTKLLKPSSQNFNYRVDTKTGVILDTSTWRSEQYQIARDSDVKGNDWVAVWLPTAYNYKTSDDVLNHIRDIKIIRIDMTNKDLLLDNPHKTLPFLTMYKGAMERGTCVDAINEIVERFKK
jgi:hypothetical protein